MQSRVHQFRRATSSMAAVLSSISFVLARNSAVMATFAVADQSSPSITRANDHRAGDNVRFYPEADFAFISTRTGTTLSV
jgi:hypothetical protein